MLVHAEVRSVPPSLQGSWEGSTMVTSQPPPPGVLYVCPLSAPAQEEPKDVSLFLFSAVAAPVRGPFPAFPSTAVHLSQLGQQPCRMRVRQLESNNTAVGRQVGEGCHCPAVFGPFAEGLHQATFVTSSSGCHLVIFLLAQ